MVEVTYTGAYSAIDVIEIKTHFERGVPEKVDRAWAAKAIGLSPTQWRCEDEGVLAAAEEIARVEAAALEEFIRATTPPPAPADESE